MSVPSATNTIGFTDPVLYWIVESLSYTSSLSRKKSMPYFAKASTLFSSFEKLA